MPDATTSALLSARERPARPHVMLQRWERLAFLHWRWDPDVIQRTLPPGLTVDTFQDSAWLAIVPFFMRGIRPRFCPAVPGISDFLELNVRTYVRDAQGRHGVWFYSLDCDQPLAVWTARTFFHLPYQHARMSATIEERGSVLECAGPPALSDVHQPAESSRGLEHSKTLPRTKQTRIDYACHRRGEPLASRYRFQLAGETRHAEPGTLEFFLAERYLLLSQTPRGLRCGQVHHTPYRLAEVTLDSWDVNPLIQAGFDDPKRPPDHVIGSPGVDVLIYALTP